MKYLFCFGRIYWCNQLKTFSNVACILIFKLPLNLMVNALFLSIPVVAFALSDEEIFDFYILKARYLAKIFGRCPVGLEDCAGSCFL